MPHAELHSVIRTVLCRGLSGEQAEQLVAATVPLRAPAGAVVFTEGDKSTGLLIFLRGSAEVLKQTANGETQTLATVTAPTVLGEMGLLTDRPRTATVRTLTDCEFHLLTRTQFHRLLEHESLAAYKLVATVANVLAHRLDLMDQKVLELTERHHDAAPVEELDRFRHKLFTEWAF
jgi:CRP/FNR family transcriptional regulator, cyclic AMP receptor protein